MGNITTELYAILQELSLNAYASHCSEWELQMIFFLMKQTGILDGTT